MKRVLLVYSVSHQKALMESIQANVASDNISIDLFDITSWEISSPISNSELYANWYGKILRFLTKYEKDYINVGRLVSLLHLFFDRVLIRKLFIKYDIIDFQYYNRFYYSLIPLAKSLNKKVKINLWGSDLFRVSKKGREDQIPGYELADLVQVATLPMYEKLVSEIPQIKGKINVLPFGNQKLSDFVKLYDSGIDSSFLPNYNQKKIMVVLGYNGSEAQQHLLMINMLNELPDEIQNQLYIVLPMTYGLSDTYKIQVLNSLKGHQYTFDLIDTILSEKQLFDLRRLSIITVNIQVTDAFSGSLQEHILCGNILLVGEWLPYSIMKNAGIFYLTTSLEKLKDSFLDVYANLALYHERCKDNKEKMYNLSSWSVLSKKWASMYNSL